MPAHRMINLGFTEEAFPAGTHMCYIYADDHEHKEIVSKFVESAVPEQESVSYFADVLSAEDLPAHLARLGIRLPQERAAGHFESDLAHRVYCPDGTFVPQRMLDRTRKLYLESVRAGYSGARETGEMTWALKGLPGSERLIEYESGLNAVVRECPVTLACQYDARRFSGATLYDVLSVHPYMIVHGQIVRNPYYRTQE
jgi:hypothetical protein